MRTREEIEEVAAAFKRSTTKLEELLILIQVELLLDIRDLLQNPPVEITGEAKQEKHE